MSSYIFIIVPALVVRIEGTSSLKAMVFFRIPDCSENLAVFSFPLVGLEPTKDSSSGIDSMLTLFH